VLLPLVVADLPVILWCRAPRLLALPDFRQIASLARKVVLDSAAMPDAKSALRQLVAARSGGLVLGDLSWTRLTRWREMLSQVFENRERLAQIASIRRVAVSYGGGYEAAAWYMAAWIGDALAGAGAHPTLTVKPSKETTTLRVELEGDGLRVDLSRHDETLVVRVNELSHYTSLPHPTDYLLMREELGIMRRDDVFGRALASAARLAYPTEK
jgi:hypothetical protein